MILYHASKAVVEFPEVRKTRYTKDLADDTIWNYVNDFLSGRISRKQF